MFKSYCDKAKTLSHLVCQIGDQEARDQVHTVEILVPPSVRPVPQNGQITARKASTVTLECKASGNPVPNLSWHKKVRTDFHFSLFCFVLFTHFACNNFALFLLLKYSNPIWFYF